MMFASHKAWLMEPDLQQVFDAIAAAGGEVRCVGGAVRNALLGIAVEDVDLATTLHPTATISALEQAGIKAVPTGISHGTITAVIDEHSYQITTLRRDVATDGRRAQVAYQPCWQEDAARRDFTINALYCDRTGILYDPLQGMADFYPPRIRFIGDAAQRIQEDGLRILRYGRFTAQYQASTMPLDSTALEAIAAHKTCLNHVSAERISKEVMLLLATAKPARAVQALIDTGVLPQVLPCAGDSAQLDTLPPQPLIRLAWLGQGGLGRMRLSRSDQRFLATIVGLWQAGNALELQAPWNIIMAEHGLVIAEAVLLLTAAQHAAPELLAERRAFLQAHQYARFPLDGTAAMQAGHRGEAIGKTLRAWRTAWASAGFPADFSMPVSPESH